MPSVPWSIARLAKTALIVVIAVAIDRNERRFVSTSDALDGRSRGRFAVESRSDLVVDLVFRWFSANFSCRLFCRTETTLSAPSGMIFPRPPASAFIDHRPCVAGIAR